MINVPTFSLRRAICALVGAAVVLLPLFAALRHNLHRPYYTTSDADIIYLGEALRFAQGIAQHYNDHPGYLYTLLLSWWLKAGAALGLLPAIGVDAAAAAADIDAYFQAAVVAGRWYSITVACGFVFAFMCALRAWGIGRNTVLAAGLILASSQAVAIHAVLIRAELQSAAGPLFALLALGAAAQRNGPSRWGLAALAGTAAVIGLENKVQAIIPLSVLPAAAVLLPHRGRMLPSWGPASSDVVMFHAAAAFTLPAFIMIAQTLWNTPFTPAPAGYQAVLAAWIAAAAWAWRRVNAQSGLETARGLTAMAAGAALGLYLLWFHHSHRTTDALVHFVEHMQVFSGGLDQGAGSLTLRLISHFWEARTVPQALPQNMLDAAVLTGIIAALRNGALRPALTAAALLAMGMCITLAFGLRGYPAYYQIYVFPLHIIAGAVLCHALPRWAILFAAAASTAVTAVNLRITLADDFVSRQNIANLCSQADTYLPPRLAERFHRTCAGG